MGEYLPMKARYPALVVLLTLVATDGGCSSEGLRLSSHSDAASLAPGGDAAPISQPPTGSECPDGYSPCGAGDGLRCYDLSRSPDHCGACGTSCAAGIVCQTGACQQHRCTGPLSFKTMMLGSAGSVFALGDFDGDGILDLVGAWGDSNSPMSLQYGVGDGTFSAGQIIDDAPDPVPPGSGTITPVSYCYGWQALVADLNGDGLPDLTSIGCGGDSMATGAAAVRVRLGSGSRNAPFAAPTSYPTASGALSLLLADFDADSYLDLVVGEAQGFEYWHGQGDGQFERQTVLTSGTGSAYLGPGIAVATDWNRDGVLDLVYGLSGTSDTIWLPGGNLYYRLGHGDGSFDAEVVCPLVAGIVGDLDHDGMPDLISSSSTMGATMLLGIKGCSASRIVPITDWTKQGGIALADLNGDGNLDVIVDDNQAIAIHVGDGQGGFPEALTLPVSTGTAGEWPMGTFLVGDLNRDGKPDIVFARGGAWGALLNTCP